MHTRGTDIEKGIKTGLLSLLFLGRGVCIQRATGEGCVCAFA